MAVELGCAEQTLRNWLRQDQADRGERQDLLSSEERQRLRELERENKVLRQEREILTRAAATIVAVTDTYLAATTTRREEIVGRPLFDIRTPAVAGGSFRRGSGRPSTARS